MNRRDFLKTILALGMAPAVIKADRLMRVRSPRIILPRSMQNGDIFTIGGDPQSYIVTDMTVDLEEIEPFPAAVMAPAIEAAARKLAEAIERDLFLFGTVITRTDPEAGIVRIPPQEFYLP